MTGMDVDTDFYSRRFLLAMNIADVTGLLDLLSGSDGRYANDTCINKLSPMLKKTTGVNREKKLLRGPRPRRGDPAQTRQRLIAAAATLFNRVGYHGTDSNRIAKEAGYSPGTFYKHFKEKRDIFLAAYEGWIVSEWEAFQVELASGAEPQDMARRLVELQLDFHTRWRGLRASLLELVFTDAVVKTVLSGSETPAAGSDGTAPRKDEHQVSKP